MPYKYNVKLCRRCGHTWDARVVAPRRCPHCMSPLWNVPREAKGVTP